MVVITKNHNMAVAGLEADEGLAIIDNRYNFFWNNKCNK